MNIEQLRENEATIEAQITAIKSRIASRTPAMNDAPGVGDVFVAHFEVRRGRLVGGTGIGIIVHHRDFHPAPKNGESWVVEAVEETIRPNGRGGNEKAIFVMPVATPEQLQKRRGELETLDAELDQLRAELMSISSKIKNLIFDEELNASEAPAWLKNAIRVLRPHNVKNFCHEYLQKFGEGITLHEFEVKGQKCSLPLSDDGEGVNLGWSTGASGWIVFRDGRAVYESSKGGYGGSPWGLH